MDSLPNGGSEATNSPDPTIFGTDEFAGDREIAYFVASVEAAGIAVTAAATATTTSLANAAGGNVAAQRARENAEQSTQLVLQSVTLCAVPVHAIDPTRPYNPYHLRIVRREIGGGHRGHRAGRRTPGDSQAIINSWDLDADTTLPGDSGVIYSKKEVVGRRDGGEEEQAPGFETAGVGVKGIAGKGEKFGSGVELASFCATGITYVNVHGNTSVQTLQEWRREKERFDAMWRMRLCRR